MVYISSLIAHHGYLVIFLIVLAEAVGLPAAASLALLAGGAAAALGVLRAPEVLLLPLFAWLLGDCVLYFLGRYTGWALLGFLCKVSVNPETCILRSAEVFYKRGGTALVVAKFVPGLNTMAAPLAGSMRMRFGQFLRVDLAGALLYTLVFVGLGYFFHGFLVQIVHGLSAAGHAATAVVLPVVAVYAGYRVWLYKNGLVYRVVPRVKVEELARKLQSENSDRILLMDVRSHGYYDRAADRIKGSIRFEPNNFLEEVKKLPKDREIYLYCTCPREATSARVVHMLRERGFNAFVIVGGLMAWRKAGYPVETVPADDVVRLPTFS